MIRKFLLLIFVLASSSLSAQYRQDPNADKILDAVSARYKKLAGFRASFRRESQNNAGGKINESKGSIVVGGNRYCLKTGNIVLFCDGKTVRTADSKAREISVSDYSPDPDDITPERVYTFYQKGYKYIFMGEVKNGNSIWQTIDLEPENLNKEISKIRLFVDKKSLEIKKWIVYERGSNDREEFVVETFQALKVDPEKELLFNQQAFPGYKTIDLR